MGTSRHQERHSGKKKEDVDDTQWEQPMRKQICRNPFGNLTAKCGAIACRTSEELR